MEENPLPLLPETNKKRPNLLTVLCILTFIGSGMNMFSSLVIAGFYDIFVQIAEEFAKKFTIPGIEQLMEAKPAFFLVSGICYAGSVVGAILMMRLKKAGFHVYAIFQILLVLAPMYFMHYPSPGIPDVLFSGLFILLYSMNLKHMS
ncbi:MAG: hypothetical protein WCR01_08380 [Bacteroidota bacterium]